MKNCLINYKKLNASLASQREDYRLAYPYPHIVIDDFLDNDVLRDVIDNFPEEPERTWISRESVEASVENQRAKWDFCLGRKDLDYELSMHPVVRYLLLELNSITFLRYLQRLTGIGQLISDPKMWGGGLHQSHAGGMLRIHADFLNHPNYHLDRRLNVLLYLNERWDPQWGGALELWTPDMKVCAKKVQPIANRLVVFTTSKTSYHGYTDKMSCPLEVSRNSIAMYYYTVPQRFESDEEPETYWQALPDEQMKGKSDDD